LGLTPAQQQRAIGAVIGMATGDTLGSGSEAPQPPAGVNTTRSSTTRASGEWTSTTSTAIPILHALAEGRDLLDQSTVESIAAAWLEWSHEAEGVGGGRPHGRSAGPSHADGPPRTVEGRPSPGANLLCAAPIALGYLDDPDGLTAAATRYGLLMHGDPVSAQAYVLWSHAQLHAIQTGGLDIRTGLRHLDADAAATWAALLDEAEAGHRSAAHQRHGGAVRALQAAWSAIVATPVPALDTRAGTFPADHFADALGAAVGLGIADAAAAVAGGLLGAAWGVSAIPARWRRRPHGESGMTGQELLRLAGLAALGGVDGQGWPTGARIDYSAWAPSGLVVRHPHDDGVLLGDVAAAEALPAGVDAVVSLCRLGTALAPVPGIAAQDHVEMWLIDQGDRRYNPHLEFVLHDAVAVLAELRSQGRTVLLHCVAAQSRTPTVAALYGARVTGMPATEALAEVRGALGRAEPNPTFTEVLRDW